MTSVHRLVAPTDGWDELTPGAHQHLDDPADRQWHDDAVQRPGLRARSVAEDSACGQQDRDEEPAGRDEHAPGRHPVPCGIGRPAAATSLHLECVQRKRGPADDLDHGTEPDQAVAAESKPERDRRCSGHQARQGDRGTPTRHDPRSNHRWCEMDQRGGHDHGQESEDIEPGVSGLQQPPPFDDWRIAREHQADERDTHGDLHDRGGIGHEDHPAPGPKRSSKWPERRE